MKQEETLVLRANGNVLNMSWESNNAADELIAYVREESIVVEATRYSGFEQVGSLPQYFSRKDVQSLPSRETLCSIPTISLSYSSAQTHGAIRCWVTLKGFLSRNYRRYWDRIR